MLHIHAGGTRPTFFFLVYLAIFYTSVLPLTRLGEFSTLLPGGEDDDNNQVAPSYQLDQP